MPLLLDMFCGGGGAGMGYHRAGFTVIGVDIVPMPDYPFEFIQGDALEFAKENAHQFDAIHASPPCKVYSSLASALPADHKHVGLLPQTREVLTASGLPFIIENVPGAPMLDPVLLCGSMFGLRSGEMYLRRHRLFESNRALSAPGPCNHAGRKAVGVYGGGPSPRRAGAVRGRSLGGYQGTMRERVEAMEIDWMGRDPLSQAIPPAYTQHLGKQLLRQL